MCQTVHRSVLIAEVTIQKLEFLIQNIVFINYLSIQTGNWCQILIFTGYILAVISDKFNFLFVTCTGVLREICPFVIWNSSSWMWWVLQCTGLWWTNSNCGFNSKMWHYGHLIIRVSEWKKLKLQKYNPGTEKTLSLMSQKELILVVTVVIDNLNQIV